MFDVPLRDRIRSVETLQDLMGQAHDVEELIVTLNRLGEPGKNNAARNVSSLIKFFEREHQQLFSEFEEFMKAKGPWTKRVRLRLPR